MIREAISQVVEGGSLTPEVARAVMLEMMSGSATDSQIASFMTAMRMKGETIEEIAGFARAMRESASAVMAPEGAVDLCGTGGDGSGTFNISTIASFIVAASGVPVAKHGNRSVSSSSGSADLLEAMGLPHDLPPASVEACIRDAGIGFMFAPVFHSSMRNVLGPRREVAIRTFFNVLGPMTNPAGVRNQLMGVYDARLGRNIALALGSLGTSRAMVVNSGGRDEITSAGPTSVVELRDGEVSEYEIRPEELGLGLADASDLRGGTPLENARIALSILRGEESPRADSVLMNAAAAVYVAGRARDLREGMTIVREAVRSGAAFAKLREFASVSLGEEAARQRALPVGDLLGRRIVPEVLRERRAELTSELGRALIADEEGRALLESIDAGLVKEPSVLSVIVLSRALGIVRGGVPEVPEAPRPSRPFPDAIRSEGLSLICEYKPRAPSSPPLTVPPDPLAAVGAFERGGASAVSVLAERDFFGGGPELFSAVRSSTSLPMLYKDFVVCDGQVRLASRLGAGAVLLIAKALTAPALGGLVDSCSRHGVEPLVEVHDEADLERLASCGRQDSVRIVGVNSRDLQTLEVDLGVLGRLRPLVPEGKLLVAESGVRSPEDLRSLRGFDAALVGSALMSSADPEGAVRSLVSAGRGVPR